VIDLPLRHFRGRDGLELAYRETGVGRPLVLIHGLFSTGVVNWVRYGHAEAIAARGYRVLMPDLRGHGDSAKPHEPAAYPPDVLADDGLAFLESLDLGDYDLGGYSLGGRTVVRMLARGATPGRAVVAGVGLAEIVQAVGRSDYFRRILTGLGTFERGTPEWRAEAFLKTVGGDPVALLNVLDSTVDTPPEVLAQLTTPTLVLVGDEDEADTGPGLAAALGNARFAEMPGTHMGAVTKPQLGSMIADFLAEG